MVYAGYLKYPELAHEGSNPSVSTEFCSIMCLQFDFIHRIIMRKYTNQQLIESNRYFVKLDIDYERNSAKILFFKPKENNLKEG